MIYLGRRPACTDANRRLACPGFTSSQTVLCLRPCTLLQRGVCLGKLPQVLHLCVRCGGSRWRVLFFCLSHTEYRPDADCPYHKCAVDFDVASWYYTRSDLTAPKM